MIRLTTDFAIIPKKVREDEPYSFKNDHTIDVLTGVIHTLYDFDIHSSEKLYRVSLDLQNKIMECSDESEKFELKTQLARIDSAIRTYEDSIKGNYIDNLLRAERERRNAEEKVKAAKMSTVEKTASTPAAPPAQTIKKTINHKPKHR